jgi:Carboxypeptidase regulatory-like domain
MRAFRNVQSIIAGLLFLFGLVGEAWCQSGSQGTIEVTIVDSSGAVLPDASLKLVTDGTNDVRTAKSQSDGAHTFVNLPIGSYRLSASKKGFETTEQSSVVVEAAQTTTIRLSLKVGASNETVIVNSSATPVLEATQSSLVTVIDPKFVEDLPLIGRDIGALATLVPGYAGNPVLGEGSESGGGSWNGKVSMDGGSDIDGVMTNSTRFKGNGNVGTGVEARLENIAEMAVQSDQIDVDQGFGQNSMQVSFVTRSGTNQFHGNAFIDFQNDGLNANSWTADAQNFPKNKLIFVDWGVSGGGPVIKNKMFFYGTFATRTIPGSTTTSNVTLSPNAQQGIFSWVNGNGVTQTANLYQLAANAGLNNPADATVASEIAMINSSAIPAGQVIATSGDANINTLQWRYNNPQRYYFPLARIDYNINPKLRTGLSWTMTDQILPSANAPWMPGHAYSSQETNFQNKQFLGSYRLDWDVSPAMANEFRFGYNYQYSCNSCDAPKVYETQPLVVWGIGMYDSSGQWFYTPQSNAYPVFNASDTVTWQKKSHTLKFGFSGYREQDHYWNAPLGYQGIDLGLNGFDPAANAITQSTLPGATPAQVAEAQGLYGTLIGNVTSINQNHAWDAAAHRFNPNVVGYNLDEISLAWGLFAQDSWKATPSLTVNYGMRWDFTGNNHDITMGYYSVPTSSIYGPTPAGALFQPGNLGGNLNPIFAQNSRAYNPWYVTPQPQLGLVWNPHVFEGKLGKLLGGSESVVRAGFSFKRFTEPYQSYWEYASDFGNFFYNNTTAAEQPAANGKQVAGTFAPQSLTLTQAYNAAGNLNTTDNSITSPTTLVPTYTQAQYTYQGGPGIVGMKQNIAEPIVMSWNLGIQRKLGASRALEVRYVANHSYKQWVAINNNEVNIFENGFLTEFKLAQQNQLINYNNQRAANPGQTLSTTSFQNLGYSGQSKLPILETAFPASQEPTGGATTDWTNSAFDLNVATGAAGSLAKALAGPQNGTIAPGFCNLVGGANFSPCANVYGTTGAGAYPINFLQANPYASGNTTGYLSDIGYSNYESLQTEFRQQQWRGLQLEANYTYGHTLGNGGSGVTPTPIYTLHDTRLNYRPTTFDIRHVFHANGTYDLPIGRGKAWLNDNGVVSRVLGNWIIGSIVTMQTGTPTALTGGYNTYNDYADGGVTLGNGLTVRGLQKAVGVHRVPQSALGGVPNYVLMFNPKYLASATSGGANPSFILPNTTPGTFGAIPYIYGPRGFYQDASFSKAFPIYRESRLKFQAEMRNIWNHPVFGNTGGIGNVAVQSPTFGQLGGPSNAPRTIDMRVNIEF